MTYHGGVFDGFHNWEWHEQFGHLLIFLFHKELLKLLIGFRSIFEALELSGTFLLG